MSAQRSIRQLEMTFILTITLAASLSINSQTYASIQMNPALSGVNMLNVPADEAWVLEDLYVTASQSIDGMILFFINQSTIAFQSGNINGLVVTNVARPIPKPFRYGGNAIITVAFINLAAVGTAGATDTVYAKFTRFTPY
jgi:hypothetical protein